MNPWKIEDPALIVLVGAAGSGKSLLAAANWPGKVVSSDAMRALAGSGESDMDATTGAFELLHRVTDLRLARRLTTCADATNITREHRAPLLAIAARHRVPAVALVLWPTLETCLARNRQRPRFVPEDAIASQHARISAETPSRDEGFTRVIVITEERT